MIITMSHLKRYWLASWLNRQQRDKAVAAGIPVARVATKEPLARSNAKPHSEIFLWPGVELTACTRNERFRNTCSYKVVEVTTTEVAAQGPGLLYPTDAADYPTHLTQ